MIHTGIQHFLSGAIAAFAGIQGWKSFKPTSKFNTPDRQVEIQAEIAKDSLTIDLKKKNTINPLPRKRDHKFGRKVRHARPKKRKGK